MSTTTTITTKTPPPLKDLTFSTETKSTQKSTILDLLSNTPTLENIKQVHALTLKTGLLQDHYVSGTLIKSYSTLSPNSLDIAIKVFDYVPNPNVFVFNVVIKACLDNNEPFKAIRFYYALLVAGARPNKFTYPPLFKTCGVARTSREGMQVHSHVVKQGFIKDVHIISAGIQMYASFGLLEDSHRMLDQFDGLADVVCYNAMIDGYLKFGALERAKDLFERMDGMRNVGSWNSMINGLAKCGKVEEARDLFDSMEEKDDISWSTMIDGYVRGGYYKQALQVFDLMQVEKFRPKKFVLSSVLAACANLGALDQGRWIHTYVKNNPIYLDSILGTALVDMYAKCGRIDLAWEVFESMEDKQVYTYNAMICGLAMHGRAEDALELFSEMQRSKFWPNGITFVGVLNACAHSGLVDMGLKIFNSMSKAYGIDPGVEHYGCVVDILGRAGRLTEAEEFISSMPIEPSPAVWGALLGACRIHGDVELGEKVGRILLDLEPHNSGRYALLSNIYAKAKKWDDVANLRILMKERGVKTSTGSSVIDLGGVIYEFKMGETSHSPMKEIYMMLKDVIERLEMAGYKPNTSKVIFDIDEEEKETTLQYHSEKLAIAFGLINTNPGISIRVVKNLRMCEDCHSATKLISQVYNREINVRDRVRYHHFRDGTCSCNDFW